MADDNDKILPEQPLQQADLTQLGATGLKRFSGYIYEEFQKELIGQRGAQIYREMADNDPVIGAMLFAVEHLARQVKWRVEPASIEPEDQEAAEFLESVMEDMDNPWTDTIAEILSMLRHGYSLHEIVYKVRAGDAELPSMRSRHSDGRIGWRGLPIRSQDTILRWEFDNNGNLQGAEQQAPPRYERVLIPAEKFVLFRTTTHKNNPEGRSVLRSAYRPWYMKKRIENIEGIGIERDLAGLPVALVPPELLSASATIQQKQNLAAIQTIVNNIRQDEQAGIVFPMAYSKDGQKPLYELKLLSTGGSRQFDTDKIIQRYDQRISMVLLADFILLGHDGVGSHALGQSKIDLFSTALGSFLDIIADTFNRYAIPRLFALNDFKITDYPKLKRGEIQNVDLKELGDYITKLTAAGMPLFPNEDLQGYLMDAASLPRAPQEADNKDLHIDDIDDPDNEKHEEEEQAALTAPAPKLPAPAEQSQANATDIATAAADKELGPK